MSTIEPHLVPFITPQQMVILKSFTDNGMTFSTSSLTQPQPQLQMHQPQQANHA